MSREQAKRIADALESKPDLLNEVLRELESRKIGRDRDKGYSRGYHHQIAQNIHEWARRFGMRDSWHEPDEQEVSARVLGDHLDNAFGNHVSTNALANGYQEFVVELRHNGLDDEGKPQEPDATLRVNLANMFAIIDRYYREHVAPGKEE